jgi:putative glutathione S-transferase
MTGSKDNAVEENQSAAAARRAKGEFVRGVSGFRGTLGSGDFPAVPGRYHLYVALNCPWCHRVTLARNILGLQQSISMDVVFPNRTQEHDPGGPNNWQFAPELIAMVTGAPLPECTTETATGQAVRLVRDIYDAEGSTERSVPILYDRLSHRIVSNESAEIIRMLNRSAGPLGSQFSDKMRHNLYPEDNNLRADINALNERIYIAINNGAYKAGFSSDQAIYEKAYRKYFGTLAELESLLADGRPFLTGDKFTEADLRLFPTLYRHDPVYYVRMKLNDAKILDYRHLWQWICRVYALPGVPESGSLDHCRQGYFGRSWNNVIPLGPSLPMPYPQAYKHPDLAKNLK